jgi:DNA transformation protein
MAGTSFKDFVLDQLSVLPELRARAMFGGHGIYAGDRFFAILAEDRLYFKVNDTNRAEFLARGMKPFTYEKKGQVMSMSYYEVPPEVLEDRAELVAWARRCPTATASGAKPRVRRTAPRKSASSR